MIERISKIAHQYAGRELAVGDRFKVEPQDVNLLLALGRIEPVEGEPGYLSRQLSLPAEHPPREAQRRKKRFG